MALGEFRAGKRLIFLPGWETLSLLWEGEGGAGAVKAHTKLTSRGCASSSSCFFPPWMKRRSECGSVRLPPRARAWRPRRATTAAARAAARAQAEERKRERERERVEEEEKEKKWWKSCICDLASGSARGPDRKTWVSNLSWQTPETGWNHNVSARTGAVQRQLRSDRSPQLNFEPRWIFIAVFTCPLFAQRSEIVWMRSRIDWSAPTGEAEMIQWKDRDDIFFLLLSLAAAAAAADVSAAPVSYCAGMS